jgi:hypothetical protein
MLLTWFPRSMVHFIEHMQPRHWALLMAVAITIGWLCLRGFGGRKAG